MSPRKSLLFLIVLSMLLIPNVSAKVPEIITEDFESTIVGVVESFGVNYSEVQSSINGTSMWDQDNASIVSFGQAWLGSPFNKYYVWRCFFRIDTRTLPSNIEIQNAILHVEGAGKTWEIDEQANIQKWTDGDDGLGLDDYSSFDSINYDDGSVTWDTWIIGWNNFTISNFSLIQTRDYTDMCIRTSRDVDMNQPSVSESLRLNSRLDAVTLTVTYRLVPKGGGSPSPRPPWERVPSWLGQFLRDTITTPFWNMWIETNITFAGILASIIVGISAYLGLECYRWIRKPKKKLKITNIRFS